jgi:hypothetical protein
MTPNLPRRRGHAAEHRGTRAILVSCIGVATLAVGLSIAVRIREVYGTIESEEINALARVDAARSEPVS